MDKNTIDKIYQWLENNLEKYNYIENDVINIDFEKLHSDLLNDLKDAEKPKISDTSVNQNNIKCRAHLKGTKRWIYGMLRLNENGEPSMIFDKTEYTNVEEDNIDYKTLCVFSNYVDRFDNEIYENDIITFTKGYMNNDDNWKPDKNIVKVIVNEDGSFNIDEYMTHNPSIMIVGNYIDNPHIISDRQYGI